MSIAEKVHRILLLAGHETTANSFGWTIVELSKSPEAQIRLREEIRATEREIKARGDAEFTAQDFESMPYLTSVVKVSMTISLRFTFKFY